MGTSIFWSGKSCAYFLRCFIQGIRNQLEEFCRWHSPIQIYIHLGFDTDGWKSIAKDCVTNEAWLLKGSLWLWTIWVYQFCCQCHLTEAIVKGTFAQWRLTAEFSTQSPFSNRHLAWHAGCNVSYPVSSFCTVLEILISF